MKYKISKYLYIKKIKGSIVVYHLLNHSIFALKESDFILINNNLDNELSIQNPLLFSALQKLGVIVPFDRDEFLQILIKNKKNIYGARDYRLTINPTLECNFSCWYCYEDHPVGKMNKDTMTAVIAHISSIAQNKSISLLNLDWFGGEPLLYFDEILYPLSKSIKKIIENAHIDFTNTITTNGYLINKKRIKQFKDIGLSHFQITLDGDKEMHDSIRFSKNQPNSFEKILNNVFLLAEQPENDIALRINYTEKTFKSIFNIIDLIPSSVRKNIRILFQHVWQESRVKHIPHDELAKAFQNNGFNVQPITLNNLGYVCYADKINQAIINYDGKVFKCTACNFFVEKPDGQLLENGDIDWDIDQLCKRVSHAAFENKYCVKCNLLPVCYGPCSQKMVRFMSHEKEFFKICKKAGIKEKLEVEMIKYYNSLNV